MAAKKRPRVFVERPHLGRHQRYALIFADGAHRLQQRVPDTLSATFRPDADVMQIDHRVRIVEWRLSPMNCLRIGIARGLAGELVYPGDQSCPKRRHGARAADHAFVQAIGDGID